MPKPPFSSRQPRRKWLIPAIIAIIFFAGNLASELFGNLIGTVPESYPGVVWAIIGAALITAVVVAIVEARQKDNTTTANVPDGERDAISIGHNAAHSINVVGDGNMIRSSGAKIADGHGVAADSIHGPVATGNQGRAIQTSTYVEHQILQSPSLPSALHQLPPPPRDFTGRGAELNELMAVLEKGGVTISGLQGMGGIGKTALALKLAELLTPRYPDAQFFFDLKGASDRPLLPAEAMAHVIRAYLPMAQLPENENELRGLYHSVLHGQRALLLLDNARDARQVEPLLPPASCCLLVTSRLHFTLPGLFPKNLDILPPEDARKLLLTIAPRMSAQAEAIAKLCGYLPLALRLAASALAERIDLNPSEYVCRLTNAQQRLQLIDAALSLSYEMLDTAMQKLWRLLAVFPDTFDKGATAAVWELDFDQAQDNLSTLVADSLVDYAPVTARYHLHDLSRLFADNRMSEDERDMSHQRQATHYATALRGANELYMQGGEALQRGLALFDLEWGNIQVGQAWAAANAERNQTAAKLCSDYPDAGSDILDLRQHPRESIRWLEKGLAAARRLKWRSFEVAHLGSLGIAYANLGETRRAIEIHEQSLVVNRELGDRRAEGQILGNLGIAHANLGETQRAIEFFEQALVIDQQIGDRRGEGADLGNLGNAYAILGETRKASKFYEQVLLIDREIGNRRGESNTLGNLGSVYSDLGETRTAIEFYEQALLIDREIGNRQGEATDLWNMSLALDKLGERPKAVAHAEAALKIYEQIENPNAAKVCRKLTEWRRQ